MSEHLLNNPNGGAVAYLGNTRFSWIGLGDNLQRRFFQEWSNLGGNTHIALLNDTRPEFINSFYWADIRWTIMAMHLMGDPEMPLWWQEPLRIKVPRLERALDKLHIIIDGPNPPDPPIEPPYAKNWEISYVHLKQGAAEQLMAVSGSGTASIDLAAFKTGAATLSISRPGHLPLVQEIKINKDSGAKRKGWTNALLVAGGLIIVGLIADVLRRKKK
jgi:hypothetical protein